MKFCFACGHENPDSAASCQACNTDLSGSIGDQPTDITSTETSDYSIGDIIGGRYQVIRVLGQGGMGVVYLARDQALNDNCIALKMVHPHLISHPEARKRFKEEVITSQGLTHSNIVRVHDLKRTDDLRFFTMEYLDGKSLRQWLVDRKGQTPPFNVQEVCTIIRQILDALSYAHQYTIHRDVKPENIMVQGEFPEVRVKLLDFGIARTMSHSRFTQTSQMLGTAYYMAPEQLQEAKSIDQRADLYSVGMVLYEMLTGEMAAGRFRLPGELIDGIPPDLDAFLDKALSPKPDERFQDAEVMNRILLQIAQQAEAKISTKVEEQNLTPDEPDLETPKPAQTKAPKEDSPDQVGTGKKRGPLMWVIFLIALLGGGGWFVYTARFKSPILKVNTTPPGAAVYIDNGHLGPSPAQVEDLTNGIHGVLKITSTPSGADIILDGKKVGQTPLNELLVERGDRKLQVTKDGYDSYQRVLTVVGGQYDNVTIELKHVPRHAKLYVNVIPSDARVRVLNITQKFYQGMELEPGSYHVEVTAEGYGKQTRWVTLSAEEDKRISFRLWEYSRKRFESISETLRKTTIYSDDNQIIAIYNEKKLIKSYISSPYFLDAVMNVVQQKIDKDYLQNSGLKIYTTLNLRMLKIAETEIEKGLKNLNKNQLQVFLLCIEAETGHVKVLAGRRDLIDSRIDRVANTKRNIGSAFYPVIYAAALDNGYTPATKIVINNRDLLSSKIKPMLLREALAESSTDLTLQVLENIGIDYTIEYARKLGITSELKKDLSLALGSSDVSLLELVNAYAVFANRGYLVEPTFITKIEDRNGNILEEMNPARKRVIEKSTAYIMTSLLESVVKEGTGIRVKALKRPVAGKTGTTKDLQDAWFVGYTPRFISGVWVGFDNGQTLGRGGTGSRTASPIWLGFMDTILKDKSVLIFQVPEGVVFSKIDAETGLLPIPESKKTHFECFKEGTVPTEYTK